jgi:hypothetical protein
MTMTETPEGCECGECTEHRGYYIGRGCWEDRIGPVARGERGLAPDDRDITDITAVEECEKCGWTPAALLLRSGSWECYNCGAVQ